MKIIPLNSLVLIIKISKQADISNVISQFDKYEVLSLRSISYKLINDNLTTFNYQIIKNYMISTIETKLKLGERVVINCNKIKDIDRKQISKLGVLYNCPVFYIIVGKVPSFKSLIVTKDVLFGDKVAEVINGEIEHLKIISSIKNKSIANQLRNRGFLGITAIGDVHSSFESMKSAINWARSRRNFIVFLGDLVSYGPKPLECIQTVYEIIMRSEGILIYGNHERKLKKWFESKENSNKRVYLSEGNKITTNIISSLDKELQKRVKNMFFSLLAHSRNHVNISNILLTHGASTNFLFNCYDKKLPIGSYFERMALFGEVKAIKEKSIAMTYNWTKIIPSGKIVIVGHDVRSKGNPLKIVNKNNSEVVFLDTGAGKGGHLSSVDLRFTDENSLDLKIFNFNWH